jgi:ATP-binding cassette subfamily B protein
MKLLWRLSREASRYKGLYLAAILATLALTGVNLAAPRLLSAVTGVVEGGVDEAGLRRILTLTAWLAALYLLRVLFRFMSNYLAHRAAWYLVGDLRTRTYDKLERMHLGFFHDKQTGDLMSRVVNDTRDFELLYAHIIPESITNLVTFAGVLIVLLTINWRLALVTCAPIPLILISGVIFSKKVRPFFRVSQTKMGELNGKLQDNLSGVHEIQSFGRESYEAELKRYKTVSVLHIDDFLKGSVSEADLRLAFDLLNARYNRPSLRSVISSERSLSEILALDEAIGGRICERAAGFLVKAPAENYRLHIGRS